MPGTATTGVAATTLARSTSTSTSAESTPNATAQSAATTVVGRKGAITVDIAGNGIEFDRRLLGTNAPAWINPTRLADPQFLRDVVDLGTTTVRMPGGSWSSDYDWLACENGDGARCNWTWAAKPSDYVQFMAATHVAGMWTVNINETAQQAAALVAYFNGSVGDPRLIGVDRDGTDWGTVGKWATLRSEHGHPAPQTVRLWEVGNEVYGAKPAAGPECASFGWENSWTCDGTDYVQGTKEHDGYLAIRKAMQAVDSTILVGAVGIGGDQSGWSDFGDKVIDGAAASLDFYVVHDYGFTDAPSNSDALKRPADSWDDTMRQVSSALVKENPDRSVPVAITEYNMFAFSDGDTKGQMSKAISAFYLADSIGQMATHGVSIANQWNLLNGANSSGTGDYGVVDADTLAPKPQFYALAMWSRFGDRLLPIDVGFDEGSTLSAYAGRRTDGTVTVIVLNKTSDPIAADLQLAGATTGFDARADVMTATSMDAGGVSFNGKVSTDTNLDATPGAALGLVTNGALHMSFSPSSITLVTLTPTK